MCSAVGNVSLLDWLRLTSSFGWIGFLPPRAPVAISLARLAMTSLTFMFDWVPGAGLPDAQRELVERDFRSATSSAAATISSRFSAGSRPSSPFTSAAARFRIPKARMIRRRHRVVADREVVEAALGLGAPVMLGGDLDRRPSSRTRSGWQPHPRRCRADSRGEYGAGPGTVRGPAGPTADLGA